MHAAHDETTIVDIKKGKVFSDYDIGDRSTSQGRGTINSERSKRNTAQCSKGGDSFVTVQTPREVSNTEERELEEILAVSLPTDKRKIVGERRTNSNERAHGFRIRAGLRKPNLLDSIESTNDKFVTADPKETSQQSSRNLPTQLAQIVHLKHIKSQM